MTDLLVDLASYQAGVDLFRPAFNTWNKVNIKTSQGNWYVADRARSRAWADQARAANKGISTFHWLDASTSGAEQARIAYREMRELGGPDGMAHQADTEDDEKRFGRLTYNIWRDYMSAMQDLMGRHVINYTGDWWWQPRGWDGASVTPYLWAAPNIGYLGSYPGDKSDHWAAGYGGWDTLAAMQFRVGPIPNGGPGAGEVSMTAIRDPAVWAALTGGTDMTALQATGEGFAPYSPDTATAIAIGATSAGFTRATTPGWDDSLDTYNLQKVEERLTEKIDAIQPGGQPAQEQVDAAMLKAMSNPSVITALGDAIASHLKVV